jgi:hypothetical protein
MNNDEDDKKLPTVAAASAVPATSAKNPYEDYADHSSSQIWIGALLKFNKGDYVIGRDAEPCPETEAVALVQEALVGWILWEDSFPADHKMGLLRDGFVPPARDTLGRTDKSQWEIDGKGKARDPWQESAYVPMVSVNGEAVYTFATSSDGGRRRGLAPLFREYGGHIRQHPDEVPIVGFAQDSYMHSNREYGRIKYPLFPVKRWVKAAPYLAAVQNLTGKSLQQLEPA